MPAQSSLSKSSPALPRAALAIAVTLSLLPPAEATLIDTDGSNCTLVQAIVTAQDGSTQGSCNEGDASGPDTINMTQNEYLHSVNNLVSGSNGLPPIVSTIVINGNGHKVERSNSASAFRIFLVESSGDLTLNNVIVSGGMATGTLGSSGLGGGILLGGKLTLNKSTFSGNSSRYQGGGIRVGAGTLTLNESTISENSSSNGGGIYARDANVTLDRSTIAANSAVSQGGGIRNALSVLTMSNSTLSGNTASSGGAIQNFGTTIIKNCTFSENQASGGADLAVGGSGAFSIENTILANSLGISCSGVTGITGSNWFEDISCNGVAQGDPNLGPLADNGGPTLTHALLAGSEAIDTGDDSVCSVVPVNAVDQRGELRPNGLQCDPGSFESEFTRALTSDGNLWVIPLKNGRVVNFSL